MKLKTTLLPFLTAAFGVVGIIFRFWNTTAGTDGDGLVITGHPSTIATIALMILMAALLVVVALFMDKTPTGFQKSKIAAAGSFIAAMGLLLTAITDLNALSQQTGASQVSGLLSILLCFASVGAMIPVGLHRKHGKPVHIWCYGIILAFFILHLL